MRTIDIHAHLVPRSLWQAVEAGREWYGFRHEPGDGLGTVVGGGKRTSFTSPKVRFTPEERLKDMDAQGVDVQVVSIHTPFFGYHLDAAQGRALARDVNDEIAGDDPPVAAALRRPRHAAGAGRQGGHRRAGARGDRARASRAPSSTPTVNGEQLGRAEVPAVVQGRRGDGRGALLPPAAPAQLPDGAHHRATGSSTASA